jgi:hypothetical protein
MHKNIGPENSWEKAMWDIWAYIYGNMAMNLRVFKYHKSKKCHFWLRDILSSQPLLLNVSQSCTMHFLTLIPVKHMCIDFDMTVILITQLFQIKALSLHVYINC